jgi:hypothetical protein
MEYDVIIVGAGPAGIFTAIELKKLRPGASILMLEKGHRIEERVCLRQDKTVCSLCDSCSITTGFSGAGAFSDGKLILSPEIGGNLESYIGSTLNGLIDYVDRIYLSHGADHTVYGVNEPEVVARLKRKAIQGNLKFVEAPIRHIGTENSREIYTRIQNQLLEAGVDIQFDTPVKDLVVENGRVRGVVADREYRSNRVVAAVGREGAGWLESMCRSYGIETRVGPVDIGVRVEVRNEIMEEINRTLYESKLIFYTPTFDDMVRTFCHNPGGVVSTEYYDDQLAVVNGHSYKGEQYKTENTNFAILVSKRFTQPFNEPIKYGKYIAGLANMLSGNKVIVQRLGDFRRGRRTTPQRLGRNNIRPTLTDAVPGDLCLVYPYRIMVDIREMIESLGGVFPGLDGDETLLYGVEVKFYSNRIITDKGFESSLPGLYVAGDGAGITRGLMQASINGVLLGRVLDQVDSVSRG